MVGFAVLVAAVGYALPDDWATDAFDQWLAAFLALTSWLVGILVLARTRRWTALGTGLLLYFTGGGLLYGWLLSGMERWGWLHSVDWLWAARSLLAVGVALTLTGIALREWREWE